jgi:tetratricopeptide (TPR) repeat protein
MTAALLGWWQGALAAEPADAVGEPNAAVEEAQIDVARGRVAFELEQYGTARDRAIEALRAAPNHAGGHELYVDATTATGLGSRGLFELVAFDVDTPRWHDDHGALAVAVRAGDFKAIKERTEHLLVTWPTEPELLLPLWESEVRKVARLRDRLIAALVHPDALATADLRTLYSLRDLAMAVGDPAAQARIDRTLADRGEERPPPRPPLDRIQRTDLALQLSKEEYPTMPWGYPSELMDVGLRLEEILGKARRYRALALAWQEIQQRTDDPAAWTHEALAWLAEEELDRAMQAADAAVSRASRPRNIDLVGLNTDRQRQDLGDALLARARVIAARGDTVRALGEYGAAVLLAGETLDDAFAERLDKLNKAAAKSVSSRYPGAVPADAAVARARAEKDRETVVAMLSDARFLATVGTRRARTIADAPEAYGPVFAESYRVEADIEEQAGRIDPARVAAVVATLISGKSRPFWWARRAELHDRNGEYDAAFAAWSIARGLGVRDLDRDLERTYVGVADWEVAANNIGGAPPDEPAVEAPVAIASRRRTGPRTDRPSSAPRLGQPFPKFSIDTGYGSLTNRALEGRVAVLVFFDQRCSECLQMLPTFGRVARRLRQEGHDVMVVGVSLDDDPAAFEQVFARGQRWAELVWAPNLRRPFAVDALPTTWVVDPQGVARYFVDHWLASEELETFIRNLE